MIDYSNLYISQLVDILERSKAQISTVKPSEWAEQNIIMQKPFPGPFRYSRTPYTREIVDCLSPDHPARWVAVMKGAQIGFALDSETDIPTPNGFVKMKDIRLGDYVLSEHGEPIRVTMATELMYNHNCYKVVFTDGTEIVADAGHLWEVYDLKNVRRVLNTEAMLPKYKKIKKSGKDRNRYYIPNNKPVQGIEKKLPIDPYLLGLWLGDGCKSSNTITATKEDAIFYQQELAKRGIEVSLTPYKGQEHTYHVRVQNAFNTWKGGYNIYGNKHIPSEYFTASVQQRLDLLQGLIDTDGHIMKDGKVEFYNINKSLIEDVKTIISSLGYKVTMRERDNLGKKTHMHPTREYEMQNLFVLNFMGYSEMPVAKLPRKKDRLKPKSEIRQEISKKWICTIKEVNTRPVKCISVDSPTKLYLASKSYIPTHNSSGVIMPGIGWMIKNNPGNTFLTVGAPDLIEKAMEKLDLMIDSANLRDYIKPQVNRNKANKSGDTNFKKEFMGGYVTVASANNHKAIRQVDLQYGFFDDFEAVKNASKESGSTRKMLEQRFAAYADNHKIFYISTPELDEGSNIKEAYLLGDQRKYMIPCQCCHQPIELVWNITNGDITGGITWKDDNGRLIEDSVGYICQLCGGFFNDKNKHKFLNEGFWKPSVRADRDGFYSYHMSSLYAPIGMYDWKHYVSDWIEAHPVNAPRNEALYKTFVNVCLGQTYEPKGEEVKADMMFGRDRPYNPWEIPEKLSISDGNGRIVLLTCAADMNGKVDDARLDWEIVAWSEKGASYSIAHGSIGTFIPRENTLKHKEDRAAMTYDFNRPNSVWERFKEIIFAEYRTDTGRVMKIFRTGLDCGYFSNSHAYPFIDSCNRFPYVHVVGIKGKGEEQYIMEEKDLKFFTPAKERPNLFILNVGRIKDEVAAHMQLPWSPNEPEQPFGFMNFPRPNEGMYGHKNFYEHYQSEHRVIEKTSDGIGIQAAWKKKGASVMNHMWDCRIYNVAMRDIVIEEYRKALKVPKLTWRECVIAITHGK